MKRKTLRNMAALLLSFILLLPSPAGTGVFAAENDTADSNTVSLDVSGNSLQDSFLNSTSDTDITVEEPQNTADDTLLIPRTISAFSDEEGNEYDISVTGVLPADATLQVVAIPMEEAAVIADALAATDVIAAGAEAPGEEIQVEADESEGRIAGGLIEDTGAAFFYDISVISQGKKCQPEEYGEEVTVTLKNVSAEEIVHIKADVADENGIIDGEALSQVADDILTGALETESLETVKDGEETSFSLGSFSIVAVNPQLLRLSSNAASTHVYWEITEEGKLIIRPETGYSEGTLPNQYQGDNSSYAGQYWPWYNLRSSSGQYYRNQIESVEIRGIVKGANHIRGLLAGLTEVKSVDLSGLDLSGTTVINDMFRDCESLTSIDLSALAGKPNLSSGSQINRMFKGCSALEEINLDGFVFAGATGFDSAFQEKNGNGTISSVKSISVRNAVLDSNAVLGSNENNGLFNQHTSLTSVDLSGTTIAGTVSESALQKMFSGTGLKELTASNITFNNGAGYADLLGSATSLEKLIISGTGSAVDTLDVSNLTALKHLEISDAAIGTIILGDQLSDLTTLDLHGSTIETLNLGDLSNLTDLDLHDSTIGSVDISNLSGLRNLNTSNADVTLAEGTGFPTVSDPDTIWDFIENGTITRNLTTEQVNAMIQEGALKRGIFRRALGGILIDAGTIDDQVRWEIDENNTLTLKQIEGTTGTISTKFNSASDWPWHVYRGSIKEVKIEGAITTGADASLNGMFRDCKELIKLTFEDSAKLDMTNVTSANDLFAGTSLASFAFDSQLAAPAALRNMSRMFRDCEALTEVDLTGLDLSSLSQADEVFTGTNVSSITAAGTKLNQLAANKLFSGNTSLTTVDLFNADATGVTSLSDMFAGTENLQKLNISGFANSSSAKLKIDSLPVNIEITSYGTTYVENPVTGEWKVVKGGETREGQTAAELVANDVHEGMLDAGVYTKTGEGKLSVMEAWEDLIWEIDDGVLRIYPREGLDSANLPKMPGNISESEQLNFWRWNAYRDYITAVEINQGTVTTTSHTELRRMFQDCTKLESVDLSKFDTSGVTVMNDLFRGCTSLKEISLPLPSGSLEQVNRMFQGCGSLEKVDFTGMNMSNVSQAADIFKDCGSVREINAESMTLNQTAVNNMFSGLSTLEKAGLKNTALSPDVTGLDNLFKDNSMLQSLDITGFVNTPSTPLTFDTLPTGITITSDGTTSVSIPMTGLWTVEKDGTTYEDKTAAFLRKECIGDDAKLEAGTYKKTNGDVVSPCGFFGEDNSLVWEITDENELIIYPKDRNSGVLTGTSSADEETALAFWPWNEYRETITSVKIKDMGAVVAKDGAGLAGMFQNCKNLERVDFTDFDTTNAQVIDRMFKGCEALTQFDLSQLDTTNAVTANNLFDGCTSLETLTIPQGSFPAITQMNGMFRGCSGLNDIDIANIVTSNVVQANNLFEGCTSIEELDLSGNDLSSLQEMDGMFVGCTGMQKVYLTNSDLSEITSAKNAFKDSSVESITANGAKLSEAAANDLFRDQTSLKELFLREVNLDENASDISGMLKGLTDLNRLDIEGFKNNANARLTFDLLPTGVIIYSDGTSYVTEPITGEWTAIFGSVTEVQLLAKDLIGKGYVNGERKLIDGIYIKTGDGEYYTGGDLGDNLIWEIVGNGVLRIRPKDGTSATLNCSSADVPASHWPWNAYADIIRAVEINQGDVITQGESASSMFRDLNNLTRVDLEQFDISTVSNINYMFAGCTSLEDIALNFKDGTSANVQQINGLFDGCTSLKEIDMSGLGSSTGGVSYGNTHLINGCNALTTLNLSGVFFGEDAVLDLTNNPDLQKIIVQPANNNEKLTINLPWETNKAGTWTFDDKRFTECIVLGAEADGVINEKKPNGESKDGITTTKTSGVIEKISEYAPGFEEVGQTYYVIDKLSAYEIQVWDQGMNGGEGGYRVIRNYKIIDGEIVFSADYLPKNDDEDWMDSDEGTSFRIRNEKRPGGNGATDNGHIEILTPKQDAEEWKAGATETNEMGDPVYVYDAAVGKPDVIITVKEAALDVNGNRHDIVFEIDRFRFTNPAGMVEPNGYGPYRRALLGIGNMADNVTGALTDRVVFRNYIVQEKDQLDDFWRYGVDTTASGTGTGNRGNATKTSGTWIDASVKVADGTPDQELLFFIGDLDHPYFEENQEGYGPGSEGVILRDGFKNSTIAISEPTKLETYDVENNSISTDPHEGDGYGDYIVATWKDDATYKSRFYVEAASNGASFTWTSGLNCDTNILEVSTALDIWQGMPPVSVTFTADKSLVVGKADGKEVTSDVSEGEFSFLVEKDPSVSLEEGNLAMHPLAPKGGIGKVVTTDKKDDKSGIAVFPEMVFDISSDRSFIPIGTYYYNITEIDGGTPEMGYDTAVHKLVVEISEAETMVASHTTGYVLKAWIDGVRIDPTTYSSMETEYGTAKKAAGGAGSREYQEKVWTDGNDTYTYNEATVVDAGGNIVKQPNTWYKNGTEEVDDPPYTPPDGATADYDLKYSQAESMANANPRGTVTEDTIKQTVWTKTEQGESFTYTYHDTYDNVPLDYSGVIHGDDIRLNPSGDAVTDDHVKSWVWVDKTDPSQPVRYKYEFTKEKTRWTDYTDYKSNLDWYDDEGNTYKYEPVTRVMTLAEAERDYGWQSALIRQTLWTAPVSGIKYSYDLRTNYQNDPEPGLNDYTGENGVVYKHGTVYLDDIGNYTDNGKLEELFSGNGGTILAFGRYERVDNSFKYVHYRLSADGEGNYRTDDDGDLLFDRYYYDDGRYYILTPAGSTPVSLGQVSLPEISEVYIGKLALYGVYTTRDANSDKDRIVTPPPVTATRSLGQSWCYYDNDLSGDSTVIGYDDIPKNVTGEVALGRSGWVKYNASGEKTGEVKTPPDDAFVRTDEIYTWVKYTGDITEGAGEPADAPTLVSRPYDVSDPGKEIRVTYTDVWVRTDSGNKTMIVNKPEEDAKAHFKLNYSDAAYAVPDGIKTEYIQSLSWIKGENVYTYRNGRWYENDTMMDEGVEPPADATALLWSEDEYRVKDTGVTFTNRKWVSLTVSKEAHGDGVSNTDTFDFVVTFENLANQYLPVSVDGIRRSVQLDGSGSYAFRLRHGEDIAFEGLTVGEKYRVEEKLTKGFTTEAEVRGDTEIKEKTEIDTGEGRSLMVSDDMIIHSSVVEYHNTIVPADITIKKETLHDTDDDKKAEFRFFIAFLNSFSPNTPELHREPEKGEGIYSFVLKKDAMLTIPNVTPGTVYRVWEELNDGKEEGAWILESIDDKKITQLESIVSPGQNETHTFHNRLRSADISVTKHTIANKEGEFRFRIRFDNSSGNFFKPGKYNHLGQVLENDSYAFVAPPGGSAIFTSYTDENNYSTYEISDTSVVMSERKNGVSSITPLNATDISLDRGTGKASFAAGGWRYDFSVAENNGDNWFSTLEIYKYAELNCVDPNENIWEFTLRNNETMKIMSVYNSTRFELWEELDGGWTLVNVGKRVPDTSAGNGVNANVNWDNVDTSEADTDIKKGTVTGTINEDTPDDYIYSYTNIGPPVDLVISKNVTGNIGDRTKKYFFTLKIKGIKSDFLKNDNGVVVNGADGNPVFFDENGEYRFSLKHGESLTLPQLTSGTMYSVTEDDYGSEGYTTSIDKQEKLNKTDYTITMSQRKQRGVSDMYLLYDTRHTFENNKTGALPTGVFAGVETHWLWMLFASLTGLSGLLLFRYILLMNKQYD